jgi:hypothetical protein
MNHFGYDTFFKTAMAAGNPPYGYQCRLACGKDADPDKPETLREGTDCQSQLSIEEQSLVNDLVADGLAIQRKFQPEPLYKQTGKGHYESHTVDEIRAAKDKRTGKGKP